MTSRGGDLGKTPGVGSAGVDRGGSGEHAPATGTARVVIFFAAMWLGSVSLICWVIFSRQPDSLAGITGASFLVAFWAAGVFTRGFWFADAASSARYSAVDEQVDFVHSVEVDIASINDR